MEAPEVENIQNKPNLNIPENKAGQHNKSISIFRQTHTYTD